MNSTARTIISLCALAICASIPQVCNARAASSTTPLIACGSETTVWSDGPSSSLGAVPLGLAIADFTGDGNPDLATVELDRLNPSSARYSIEIRLTEGGHQSLAVRAHVPGLLVTAEDVTGDGNLDLVVHAAHSSVPVAIFLNDGCGHFSEASEPAAFPNVRKDLTSEFHLAAERPYVAGAVIALGSSIVRCHREESLRYPEEQNASFLSEHHRARSHSFLNFGSNRAPPLAA
jgi:hypothetical protein